MKVMIYRIIQEQLNNILKYAGATHVTISLGHEKSSTVLVVNDDGSGFDTALKTHGIGLMNIKTRASLFNGKVSVNSSPGYGCELKVIFN
jgi:signal transduction histidine kinase